MFGCRTTVLYIKKMKRASYKHVVGIIGLLALSGAVSVAGDSVELVNANLARDVYASRSSILIIGDSTNVAGGSGISVPYYEGFIQSLPDEVVLCGFRVSGSTGNTGVNGYIRFAGGSTSEMVGGRIYGKKPHDVIANTNHALPGQRWQFQLNPGGVLPSTGTLRFAAAGLTNLAGIYPNADAWALGETLVIRTPFYVSDNGEMLESISMSLLTDHDDSAGIAVQSFDASPRVDVHFDTDRIGLQHVDAVLENVESTRIGVRFSGDTDSDDLNESGKFATWCSHVLFKQSQAELNHGFYLDSISIGGYTARDHAETLDAEVLDDYLSITPREYSYVFIWLGQNIETDEWDGVLQTVWGDRIEAIGDRVVQAASDAGYSKVPIPIFITPPQAMGIYPSARFVAINAQFDEIATRRGWGHIDAQSLMGDSLASLNSGYLADNTHPSQAGSTFVTQRIYEHLNCLRAEFSGDDTRNFFDISAFLNLFNSSDPQADMNGDGSFNFFDVSAFLTAFNASCP